MSETKSPPEGLSPEQQAKLATLEAELGFESITVSFSIEDRDVSGQKRSAFVSTTVRKQEGTSGWTSNEIHTVSALVSKHVVAATFRDAKVRRILGPTQAASDLKAILRGYDAKIASSAKKL